MKARAKRIASGRGPPESTFFGAGREGLRAPLLDEAAQPDQSLADATVPSSFKAIRSGFAVDPSARGRIRKSVDADEDGSSNFKDAAFDEASMADGHTQGSKQHRQFSRYASFATLESAASGDSTNPNSPPTPNTPDSSNRSSSPDSSDSTLGRCLRWGNAAAENGITNTPNSKGLHFSYNGHGHALHINSHINVERGSDEDLFDIQDCRLSPCPLDECGDVIRPIEPPASLHIKAVLASTPHDQARIRSVGHGAEAVPSLSGEDLRRSLRSLGFTNLPQMIPVGDHAGRFAISCVGSRAPLMHEALLEFVKKKRLSEFGIVRGDRCGLLLQNGPEMATALFTCMSQCICVPININQTSSEVSPFSLA